MFVSVCVHQHVCVNVCLSMFMCVHISMCVNVCVCLCLCLCVCVSVCQGLGVYGGTGCGWGSCASEEGPRSQGPRLYTPHHTPRPEGKGTKGKRASSWVQVLLAKANSHFASSSAAEFWAQPNTACFARGPAFLRTAAHQPVNMAPCCLGQVGRASSLLVLRHGQDSSVRRGPAQPSRLPSHPPASWG